MVGPFVGLESFCATNPTCSVWLWDRVQIKPSILISTQLQPLPQDLTNDWPLLSHLILKSGVELERCDILGPAPPTPS